MREAECFACCTYKIAFQRFARSESKRVKHQIDSVGFRPYFFKKCFDLIVAGNIAGKQWSFLSKFADQFLHVLL